MFSWDYISNFKSFLLTASEKKVFQFLQMRMKADGRNWNAAANFSYLDRSYVTHLVRDKSCSAVLFIIAFLNWFVFFFFYLSYSFLFWLFIDSDCSESFVFTSSLTLSRVQSSSLNIPIIKPFVNKAIERSKSVNLIYHMET